MASDKYNIFLEEFESQEPKEGPLKGLRIAVKDNILIKGKISSGGSKILGNHVALYDATVIRKLRDAGAVFVGRTNMDELAMGSSTENSAYGPTLNPWDESRVPGGSSGASAAAVAADLCDASLGSDTGGSIRQPAAFCSVTGFKPTYGAVSRYGLMAMASSLDQIGPFAKDAETAEKIFAVISGADEHDQTTADYTYTPDNKPINEMTIGLPKELWDLEIEPEIKAAVNKMVEYYKSQGTKVVEVSLPTINLSLPAYYVIMPAEVSSNLARYDAVRYGNRQEGHNMLETYLLSRDAGFGPESKRRILLGTFVLSHGYSDRYYHTAIKIKQKITDEFDQVFRGVDALITPTTPTLPFKIGEKTADPVQMYQSDLLTVGVNLAGVPAISLPVGFSESGLPIGGQIIAKKFADATIFNLAKRYQADNHLDRKING